MVQLQILSGKQAGARWVARRFPVRIGRDSSSDLQLEQDGVWERHCELTLDRNEGFVISVREGALMTVNQESKQSARLRNGDSIELGSGRLRFWLADPPRRNLLGREIFVWLLLSALVIGEVAAIIWKLP